MGRHAAPVTADEYTPDTAPAGSQVVPNAPLGTVKANIRVELAGYISFDASVRGAVVDISKTEGFRNLHQHDDGTVAAVKQQYVCPACDATPDTHSGFVKGRPKGGSFVVVPQDIIDAHGVADDAHKSQLTITVHDAAEVTRALPNGKVDYLAPSKKTNSHYADLAQVMYENRDLAFVGILAMKKIAYRYLLTTDGHTISLVQLADPELVRERPVANVPPSERRHGLAAMVRSVKEPFDAQLRASQRSFAVEEYVEAHAPAEIATVVAPVAAEVAAGASPDAALIEAASKLGVVLPFPGSKAS